MIRSTPKKTAPGKKVEVVPDSGETVFLKSEATIFINYRRDDSKHEAAYLKEILASQFGSEKIFRDLDSIKIGADFPEVINNTLDKTAVVIVLIGDKWLTLKTKTGQPRIKSSNDYVRIEIETALKLGKHIIPVLLNGTLPLQKAQLPASIARLSTINAVELSWFDGINKIGNTIKEIEKEIELIKEKEREKKNSLNLEFTNIQFKKNKKGLGKAMIVTAMEYSLQRSGKNILLDEKDFFDILTSYQDPALTKAGGFFFDDMVYIADFIGIKAKRGYKRYIARSMPLRSITEVPAQLILKRPVICGFTVYDSWFDEKTSKTGLIDFKTPKGHIQGGSVGVIISWNPENENIKLLTPWPGWGNKGVATISKDAMYHLNTDKLRAIEAVEKPSPYSERLVALSKKMAAANKKLNKH